MKTIIKIYSLCIILLVLAVFGCSQSMFFKIKKRIAEIDNLCFSAYCDYYKISYLTGKREEEYMLNGTNTKLVKFGLLQIELYFEQKIDSIKAELYVNNKIYIKDLIYNPIDFSYVQDFKILVKQTDHLYVKFLITENDTINIIETTLNCENKNWKIDGTQALKIATDKLSKNLSKCFKGTVFQGEVFIQIMSKKGFNKYFWLVCFYLKNGEKFQVLIDPITLNCLIDT